MIRFYKYQPGNSFKNNIENLCYFLTIIILAITIKLFSKKVKELASHGETERTGRRTMGSSQDSEDQRRRRAERLSSKRRSAKHQREAEKQRGFSPVPPKLSEIKSSLEEENKRLTKLKRVKEEIEIERSEIEELEVEYGSDEDFVSTEQVIEPPESDPGVSLVEAAPLPEVPVPISPEDTKEQDEGVDEQNGDVKAIEQNSPEDEPPDDASIKVELFCETCMGEEVITYDSEQIFKDQFQGQAVDWKGLLKSVDPLSYDRYFRAENGFLATLEIYVIKGRYDSRPVLAVVLLTPKMKASWESSLNLEMAIRGTLFALDSFGRKVYLNLQD